MVNVAIWRLLKDDYNLMFSTTEFGFEMPFKSTSIIAEF